MAFDAVDIFVGDVVGVELLKLLACRQVNQDGGALVVVERAGGEFAVEQVAADLVVVAQEVPVVAGDVECAHPRGAAEADECAAEVLVLPGGLVVAGDRIVAVGPDAERHPGPFTRVIDARGGYVLPGFVQTHVHLCQTIFRGYSAGPADVSLTMVDGEVLMTQGKATRLDEAGIVASARREARALALRAGL